MDDIFAIQDDIAQSVVGELRRTLLDTETDPKAREKVVDEVAKATKGRAADPEAHRLMLLGRHLVSRMNEADATKAVEYFRQALEIDPEYPVCWAELGRAFHIASNHRWHALDTDYEKAEEALKQALDLDPDLAEGQALLGRVLWYRGGHSLEAEQFCGRALAVAPQNIDVLLSAANVAREVGQFGQALEYCHRAIAIDPLSPTAWWTSATTSFRADDLGASELAARRALELAPQQVVVHALLGLILLRQGRPDEALAEALLEPENSLWRPWALTIIHHAAGRNVESDVELARLTGEFGFDAASQIAEAHSMRGETDEAFDWLQRSIDQRDPGRFGTKCSPLLRSLHEDQRWLPLLKKIGLS
jgi:tetratricopeptide (TPR) repeat protein